MRPWCSTYTEVEGPANATPRVPSVVDIQSGEDGRWWVMDGGVRKVPFRTRREAILYLSKGTRQTDPLPSQSMSALVCALRDLGTTSDPFLQWLDPLDQRIVKLHLQGAPQDEVAIATGLSQPAVCYRLQHIVRRLKAWSGISGDLSIIRKDLEPHLAPQDVDIVVAFLRSTNQSWVGRSLGMTQGKVYYRLQRFLKMKGIGMNPYQDAVRTLIR